MSNHLPECPGNWGVGQMPEGPCTFCEMLRACEQRVLTEFVARIQDRMTDSDLDNIVSDDGKDLIWAAIDALRDKP